MKLIKTALISGVFAAFAVLPVMADEVTIADNGAKSDNTVKIVDESSTGVLQGNATIVVTVAEVKSDSGDNTASKNTGGDTTGKTGDASSLLKVSVEGGSNEASLPEPCGCPDSNVVKIKDNGYKSDNKVVIKDSSSTFVGQGNLTGVLTLAKVASDTGDNKANANTGGNTKIKTGKASSTLKVKVTGSSNTINP